jgi:hypothetical protein
LFRQWQRLSPDDRHAMQRAATSCYRNHFGVALATQRLLAVIDPAAAPGRAESAGQK